MSEHNLILSVTESPFFLEWEIIMLCDKIKEMSEDKIVILGRERTVTYPDIEYCVREAFTDKVKLR